MPKLLLDSDDDENTTGTLGGSSSKNKLTINEDYATAYERWRRKEEMQKLKDKYGEEILSEDSVASSDDDDDDDSSDSDDSSDVDETIFDEQFFKVYGALKARDPHIYDEKVRFFGDKDDADAKTGDLDVDEDDPKTKKKSSKGMNLLEYHVNLVKKEGGITEEDRMMEKGNLKRQRPDQQGPSYVQELESIKKEFKTILQNDEDEDDLFKGVKKTPVQVAKSDPSEIFRGGSKNDERIRFLANYWDKKNLDDREKFLKDYILQKKYLDPSDREDGISARRLASGKPMISELASSSSSSLAKPSSSLLFSKTNANANEDANEDDDSENDTEDDKPGMQMASKVHEKAAAYHFQETDAEVIKRYPREIESVRNLTGSTNRNVKRSEIKERKAKEKKEALQRYRDLRRAEIKEKLAKLQEISGNDRLLTDRQIDIDTIVDDITNFDPTKYDDCMSKLFDDQFYDVSCNPNQINSAKPKFDFIPGIDDVDDNLNPINQDAGSSGSAEAAAFAEEEEDIDGGVWDDDDAGDGDDDDGPSTSKGKRKKKQNKKKTEKTPAEKKNIGIYEDLIAGEVPTRFHYRKVPANDFGLTPEELLFANDKELNAWVSLKKTSQHRTMEEEKYDIKVYGRKADNYALKKKILKSIYDPEVAAAAEAEAEAEAAEGTMEGTMEENDQQDEQQHTDHQQRSIETRHANERNTSKYRRSGHNTDAVPGWRKNKRPRNEDRDLKQINLTADRLRSYDLPQRAIKALKGKLHRQRRQKLNRK